MNARRVFHMLSALLGGLVLAVVSGFSQSTSQLHGVVTDPQGAVIAAARLTLASDGTGYNRQTATNNNGEYQFLQVPPGTYKVVVDMAGFSTLTRTDVQLLVNTPTTLDLHMELGKATQTVDVAAEASTINTVDASVGNAFSEKQVRELPLQTRNVVQLLSLEPGVTTNGRYSVRGATKTTSPWTAWM